MKIDAHQHFWHYDPLEYGWITDAMPALKRDRRPEDLHPELVRNGFEACVAVQARQTEAETHFLLGCSKANDFVKGVVGWVDLQGGDLAERLEYYRRFPELKGFRHIVQDEPDDRFLLRPRFVEGVRSLAAYGFTYDILIYEKHFPSVVAFLDHFDEGQAFVLDHIGKPVITQGMTDNWRNGIRAVAAYSNVYCKLSGMVTEANWQGWQKEDFYPFLDVVFEAFGTDRLMIGSDWPVCLLAAGSYGQVTGIVESYLERFSKSDQEKVLGLNAARFYSIH